MIATKQSVGGTMRLSWLLGLAICVLCACQPASAASALRGIRERGTGDAEDYGLEWKPWDQKRRKGWNRWGKGWWWDKDGWDKERWDKDGWDKGRWDKDRWDKDRWDKDLWEKDKWDMEGWDKDRWDKEVHAYRWSLADRDIEEVSYWFMEKLWWYLFGTDDVQVKTWWKLRKSFRNYLREWWITTPWAGVATLKTGVWYALSKLTFEELPAWWGGTMEYEKMKELLQDDDAIDQWTENIQRRLICHKKRDMSRWWKPGQWDYLPEDKWDWGDLEKNAWWRGDEWWGKDRSAWDRPGGWWDRPGGWWDKWGGWWDKWGGWWDRPGGWWDWGGWDKDRYKRRDWGDWDKKTWRRGDEGWDTWSWNKQGPWGKIRDDRRWDTSEWKRNLKRPGGEGWDSRYWKRQFKRGRSGWTREGQWDNPYWEGGGGGWDWEGRSEGDWKPWRRTGSNEGGSWGWKPWKKRWRTGDKWDRSGWKAADPLGLRDRVSYSGGEDDEGGWRSK